ncbi:MAG TPA: hypothetical protein VFO93_11265 [Hymenobacter sp.]|uniref:hypothetical protein n=1 Tax=Hymenobacter sp. TaxID=1898978 RepID=UPI002D7F9FB0|nr:hypothetical protein [Hymenobacter sp.]HET9504114.1 hypothetical protein [Hymenobacter sp.]
MKRCTVTAFAIVGALALATGCQNRTEEETWPCPTYDATITPVAGLDASLSCYQEVVQPGQFKNHVVNTMADYNALFSCTPPAIDFTKYTLLIGKTTTLSGNRITSQQLRQDCLSLYYTVNIQQNPTTVVQPAVYYALVPKLPAGLNPSFQVQVLP